MKKNLIRLATLILALALVSSANADTIKWTGATSSDCFDPTNWSPGGVPVQYFDDVIVEWGVVDGNNIPAPPHVPIFGPTTPPELFPGVYTYQSLTVKGDGVMHIAAGRLYLEGDEAGNTLLLTGTGLPNINFGDGSVWGPGSSLGGTLILLGNRNYLLHDYAVNGRLSGFGMWPSSPFTTPLEVREVWRPSGQDDFTSWVSSGVAWSVKHLYVPGVPNYWETQVYSGFPEPTSMAMIGMGSLTLLLYRLRRRK